MTLLDLIRSDFERYRAVGEGQGSRLGVVLLTQGFWASTVYRLAHAVHTGIPGRVLRYPLRTVLILASKGIEVLTGIAIPAECRIGPGLYIGHFGPIILHPKAVLGENCNLSQSTTLGMRHDGPKAGVPRLGNRVYVGPNTVIIGSIEIGDDAAIGAGSVLLEDVAPRGVVAGNPARRVSRRGSFKLVRYRGMEDDPQRRAALEARQQEDPESP